VRDEFTKAIQFRHACRSFDETKRVSRPDLEYILEAGRMSPSSLGIEPWRFLVVEDVPLRRRLRPSCWNQVQITTASAVVVILARNAEIRGDSPYVRRMLGRMLPAGAKLDTVVDLFREMPHGASLLDWSIAQCHIAATMMMMAAAAIGVDSCPIGGFMAEPVADILKIDRTQFEIALLLAIGYRSQEPGPRHRLPFADVVEFR